LCPPEKQERKKWRQKTLSKRSLLLFFAQPAAIAMRLSAKTVKNVLFTKDLTVVDVTWIGFGEL
jgi:hypothetical protein